MFDFDIVTKKNKQIKLYGVGDTLQDIEKVINDFYNSKNYTVKEGRIFNNKTKKYLKNHIIVQHFKNGYKEYVWYKKVD